MRYFYAEIENGKCKGVLDTHEEIISETMIPIESYDLSYLGRNYSNSTWSDDIENNLYAHIAITGGDGMDPAGIEIDGEDSLVITTTIKTEAGATVTAFSGKWRFTVRRSDGSEYDVIGATFVSGVAVATITPERAAARGPGVCSILESDLVPVTMGGTTYNFKLTGDTTWKVYQDA